jgi:GNAT superfamily N-acetyltransferase
MQASDLAEAASILRIAFGTFIGAPEPESLWLDKDYIATRWRANRDAALSADMDGVLAGSIFAAHWGSFAYFGPLTVRPAMWDRGVSQRLLDATLELFASWGVRESGLFTFAHSPKHIHLYEKFGYSPRFLTALLSKTVERPRVVVREKYSESTDSQRLNVLGACRTLTDSLHDGLDVSQEIRSVHEQGLGETVVIWDRDSLDAFAVCHCGEATEAGADTCYIKFAAVRAGRQAATVLGRLLDACEQLALDRGLARIEAGVNVGRCQAYRIMVGRGYRTQTLGVAMHRPNSPGYNRPEIFIIDDWR